VGEFAQTDSELATSDLGKSLSHYLEALAELERKAQETESAQARADLAMLLSTADECARLVDSVRVSAMTALITRAMHADWFFPTDGLQFACARVSCVAKCRSRAPAIQTDSRAQSCTRQGCE